MVFNNTCCNYYHTKIRLICHSKTGITIYRIQRYLVASCRQQEQFYAHKQQKDSNDFSKVLLRDSIDDTPGNRGS